MLLIRNGHIRPITSPDIACGEILVDEGKIIAIGEHVDAPADVQIIDAQGMLVTPGFVDGHCHIGMHEEASRWEGNDTNEYSDPVTPQVRAIDSINPLDEAFGNALRGGVTTAVTGPGSANVIGGAFCAMKLHGDCVDDMLIKEPVAMKIAFGENPKGAYGQNGKKAPVTRMMTAALLRENLKKAQRYMEEVDAAEKDENQKRPFDMKMEALLPVMRGEVPLKSHAHRADDIMTSIRVAKEFGVKITLDHCTEGHLIVRHLAEFGAPVLVGPSFGSKSKQELKEKSFATPGILEKAGLNVSIITDAPVIPLYYLPLCAGLAVREGMSYEGAWKAITINPARVAGIDGRVGSLEVGKDADIVLFSGDPLKDIGARAKLVLVNGKIAFEE
ncbi:MAG: amidohydrolase [Clostridia bacterium]|nr:amidohydrolase [Clostridia bacterium]